MLLSLLFIACSTRPWNILSENKMEAVLYDLYIAEAGISENYKLFLDDPARKNKLLEDILNRHGITRATLDTSLTWYAGNLDKYVKINEKIEKRYNSLLTELKQEQSDSLIVAEARAERKNRIIIDEPYFFITVADRPFGVHRFRSDTIPRKNGGIYELSFDIFGVSDSANVEIGFRVSCIDTVYILRDTISVNGRYTSSIDVSPTKKASRISGEFHFPKTKQDLLYIGDLSIRRK
ncbi:MAG: DUF4296 domain-containing protein [Dysgonamonadaceae bacterium]|nr:DUF4296 domain-containing protein [Dysgonamonadaceae bacterium]